MFYPASRVENIRGILCDGQIHQGHIPKAQELRKYYKEQLALAEQSWGRMMHARDKNAAEVPK